MVFVVPLKKNNPFKVCTFIRYSKKRRYKKRLKKIVKIKPLSVEFLEYRHLYVRLEVSVRLFTIHNQNQGRLHPDQSKLVHLQSRKNSTQTKTKNHVYYVIFVRKVYVHDVWFWYGYSVPYNDALAVRQIVNGYNDACS